MDIHWHFRADNLKCTTGPEPTTGACYWKVATSADWKAALKTCQDAGGTLAMVKSAAIHSFLNTAGLLRYARVYGTRIRKKGGCKSWV